MYVTAMTEIKENRIWVKLKLQMYNSLEFHIVCNLVITLTLAISLLELVLFCIVSYQCKYEISFLYIYKPIKATCTQCEQISRKFSFVAVHRSKKLACIRSRTMTALNFYNVMAFIWHELSASISHFTPDCVNCEIHKSIMLRLFHIHLPECLICGVRVCANYSI